MNDERKRTIEEITSKTNKTSLENEQEEVPTLVPIDTKEDISKMDTNSQKYRLSMIEKALSDVRSMRSYTSASTIAPEVVKQQVKKNLEDRQKKMERKKAIAKGEASAVTRQRRDNRETIRESHGLWGWAE